MLCTENMKYPDCAEYGHQILNVICLTSIFPKIKDGEKRIMKYTFVQCNNRSKAAAQVGCVVSNSTILSGCWGAPASPTSMR